MNILRASLHRWVESGTPTVVSFQNFFGLENHGPGSKNKAQQTTAVRLHRQFWRYYFQLSSELGNESFFIIALPLLYWNGPNQLARTVVSIWALTMYIGQCIKDSLKLPRPPSPPVIKLENWYEAEYGLPSTHCIGGIIIPFTISSYCYAHHIWSLPFCMFFALAYSSSVISSRLYLGVHSPADLLCGAFLAFLSLAFFYQYGHYMDQFVLQDSRIVFFLPAFLALLLFFYPRVGKWTNCYGDSAILLGVLNGVLCGVHYYHNSGIYNERGPSFEWQFSFFFKRFTLTLIGVSLLIATKVVFKSILTYFLVSLLPKSKRSPLNRYEIEIPTKFITYSLIGFNASFCAPYIFNMCNLV